MNKLIVAFFLFLFSTSYSFGQTVDTIYLKEIQVKKKSKGKIVKLKSRGESSSLTGEVIKSAISRMDSIPSGKLSSIKFYFNHNIFDLLKGKNDIDYKDLELGLLILSVNEDGSPGQPLADNAIRFTVNANHSGPLELDLSPLYLNTEKSMYFGFELFTRQTGKNLRIMIETGHEIPKAFYITNWNNSHWNLLDFGDKNLTLKTQVSVVIPK